MSLLTCFTPFGETVVFPGATTRIMVWSMLRMCECGVFRLCMNSPISRKNCWCCSYKPWKSPLDWHRVEILPWNLMWITRSASLKITFREVWVIALLTRLNLFMNLLHHWSEALKSMSLKSCWTIVLAISWMSLFKTFKPLFRSSRMFWYTWISIWGYFTVRFFFGNPGGPADLWI